MSENKSYMQDVLIKAKTNMAFAGALMICIGLMFSPALQSAGVVFIFLHPFINKNLKAAAENIRKNKFAAGLALFYLLIVSSAFHTSHWALYKSFIFMQLPLVLLPFGLYKKDIFNPAQIHIIFFVFTLAVLIAGLASFGNYMLHFEAIQESITHSKPIPIITGINHIYYSIMLAFSAVLVQWAIFFGALKTNMQKKAGWICLITIIVLLHTISARTGLVCFYAEAVVSVIWLIIVKKKIWAGFGIIAGLAVFAAVAITIIPSIKNRLANTELDLHKYESGGDINHYSISMRLAALKTAAKVFKKNPVFGVGPSEVQDAMNIEYSLQNSQLIEENRKKPHNQFLYTLVSLGLIGGLVLCFFVFMPFVSRNFFYNYLFFAFMIICIVAFQVEYMLERQAGITFFCLFYIILSSMKEDLTYKRKTLR